MIEEPDGDPFAGFEITQEWASGANRHEEAASERAVRYSKINRAHQQVVAEQQETVIQKSSRHPRNWGKVVPWFAFAAICAAFIGLSFVLNGGIGSVHAARTNDGPPVGIGEQDGRIFPPVASNGSKDFIIEQTNPDGTPVTFSPCRPWHIVINTTGAPPGAYQSVVRAAVNDGQTEYGVGDLAGLAAVGNGKCSPNI